MRSGLLDTRPTGGRRLNALQWFGLGAAPLAWAAMQVFGWGLSELHCASGGSRLGIHARGWQIAATSAAFCVWLLAAAAALVVYRATRVEGEDPDPPLGRAHMLAVASLAVNAVFFVLILLAGISTAVATGCHRS
jgi:hypothetical protein